jgi:hypothetical protein
LGRELPQLQACRLPALAPGQAAGGETRPEVPQAHAARISALAREQAAGRDSPSEFVVTDRTEVLLNGKPCRYADVPGHATIVRMEVAADNKTVLRIHFQTRK